MQTAFEIVYADGYRALTIAALSEGAGIRRNSYYTHFKDLSEVVDAISSSLLNKIGHQSVLDGAASSFAPSAVLCRVRYVLSLRTAEPETAFALSELYANDSATTQQVRRRLKRDLLTDRRRGLHNSTNRECEIAAMMIASGAMAYLRQSDDRKPQDKDLFLALVVKICGYSLP